MNKRILKKNRKILKDHFNKMYRNHVLNVEFNKISRNYILNGF